jgi:hypothetical protein
MTTINLQYHMTTINLQYHMTTIATDNALKSVNVISKNIVGYIFITDLKE